jgi:hypothetical protein
MTDVAIWRCDETGSDWPNASQLELDDAADVRCSVERDDERRRSTPVLLDEDHATVEQELVSV